MTAATLDLTLEQGADYAVPFAVSVALAGATAVMQVRPAAGDPVALLTLSTADRGLVLDPAAGTVTPSVPAAVTAALPAGLFAYDLKVRDAAGRVTRTHQGGVRVSAEVTTPDPPLPPPAAGQFNFSLAGNSGLFVGAL